MKKLELQNFGVVEMDAREMDEIDGGFLGYITGIIAVVAAGYAVGKEIGKSVYEATHH